MKCVALLPALILVAVFSCSRSPLELSGGSTSTGNERIIGMVFYPNGLPASRARVIPRRSDYLTALDSMQGKKGQLLRNNDRQHGPVCHR